MGRTGKFGLEHPSKMLNPIIRKETVTPRVRIVPSLEGKDDLRLNLSL